MIELVFMASVASVASSSFGQPPPPLPLDSVVLIASASPSSPSIPSPAPVPSTPAPVSGSAGSQPVYPSSQQETPRFQPQQQQPKESWAEKMWRRYNDNKGRN